jgi:hypothetical protein
LKEKKIIYYQKNIPKNQNQFMGRPNINNCTVKDLCKLPGIGKVTAKKVIEHRPYANIEALKNIPGLSDYKYLVLVASIEAVLQTTVAEKEKQKAAAEQDQQEKDNIFVPNITNDECSEQKTHDAEDTVKQLSGDENPGGDICFYMSIFISVIVAAVLFFTEETK